MGSLPTVGYEPAIEQHPAYTPDTPDFEVGDVVKLLAYSGVKTKWDGGEYDPHGENERIGQVRFLSDDRIENVDDPETELVTNTHIVVEDDGFKVKVKMGMNGTPRWIPRDLIVGVDPEKKAEYEERQRARERREQRIETRRNTDLEMVMGEVIKPHARKMVSEAWPGGTVSVDDIAWFWNTRLRSAAGKAYWGTAVPEMADGGRLAIGLAPEYYYEHGIDELLAVVRHELIHIWQYEHPEGDGGHGPTFHQWTEDLDTHRHCKHW